jgi:hypothetical protein
LSSVFVVANLSGELLEVVRAYLGWHGLQVFCDSEHGAGRRSEDGILDSIARAEVFLFIGSSESVMPDGREELLARRFDHALATGSRIVVVDVFDRLAPARPGGGATDSLAAGIRSTVGRHVGEPDVTLYSAELCESALRSLLGVTLSSSIRLDRDLSGFTTTIAEWRMLLFGVQAAVKVGPTEPVGLDSYARMRTKAESARIDGDKLMGMCEELPDVAHRSMARRAIVVGLLRSLARHEDTGVCAPTDVRPLWRLLQPALDGSSGIPLSATLGSQGFYVIPLFSLVRHGRIEELLRLHIWSGETTDETPAALSAEDRAGGLGGTAGSFSVHSHQPYATSWVLSGGVRNRVYCVREWPSGSPEPESHNIFRVAWDGDSSYSLGHGQSSLRNTQVPVSVALDNVALFRAGHSYVVPAGEFHSTDALGTWPTPTATLFYFDATVGWLAKAGVVGPVSVERSAPYKKSSVDGIPLIERASGSIDLS